MKDENYPLIVLRKDGRYVVQAPAFGLVRAGDDLASTEQDARAAMREALDAYDAAGVAPPEASTSTGAGGDSGGSVRSFTIKTVIASTAVLLMFLVVGIGVKMAFTSVVRMAEAPFENYQENVASETTSRLLANGVAKVADTLDNVTPERRTEVVENLRRISLSLEPYMAQLRPLFGSYPKPVRSTPIPPHTPRMKPN